MARATVVIDGTWWTYECTQVPQALRAGNALYVPGAWENGLLPSAWRRVPVEEEADTLKGSADHQVRVVRAERMTALEVYQQAVLKQEGE